MGPVDKGEFFLIDPKANNAVKLGTIVAVELAWCDGVTEISPIYDDAPNFVVLSDDLAQDAYRVVRDARRAAKKVGLADASSAGRSDIASVLGWLGKPCPLKEVAPRAVVLGDRGLARWERRLAGREPA